MEDPELELTEEHDEEPYVEFDISVSPTDLNLEQIVQLIQRSDMIIPFYQRRYVWNIEQASKLIESFLMGLPVPQIFLYVNDQNQLEVIDGQQRVMSIKYFFEGLFGEPDNKGRRQEFRLKGLSQRSSYNGLLFDDLSDRDKRKLRNSTLRAINIKQIKPNDKYDSVFHIFERLNTGGTSLKAQEIRNAVYRGNIVDELQKINENSDWQAILGLKSPDKSQKDVELVLRLFSLFERWENYEKPMLHWLNNSMAENRDFSDNRAKRFKKRFQEVCEIVNKNIEKPFRPRRVINSAVLEAIFVTMLEDADIGEGILNDNYENLLRDDDFQDLITGGTTDTLILKARIAKAKEFLSE